MIKIRKRFHFGLLATIVALVIGGVVLAPAAPTSNLVITEVMSANKNTVEDEDGDSPDWVELFNAGENTVALTHYWLTDDPNALHKWAFPDRALPSGEFLLVFASGKDRRSGEVLHANFKLGAGGEYLSLVKADQPVQAFEPNLLKLGSNESYGMIFRGGEARLGESGILSEPTPGAPNSSSWALPRAEDAVFSVERGFYEGPFEVAISSGTDGALIRYTTDGKAPSETHGEVYQAPIEVSTTTTLRAIALAEDHAPSEVGTHTYIFAQAVVRQPERPKSWPRTRPGRGGRRGFFGFGSRQGRSVPMDYAMAEPSSVDATEEELVTALKAIPSFSIVTDQESLFDRDEGIFAHPGNRGRDWERPISIELIDPSGEEPGFQWNAGLRIRGGHSRTPYCAKHAFRVYFRDDYGDGQLDYPLFGSGGVDEFDDVDLRTAQNYSYHYSGEGAQNTMVREVFARDSQRAFGQPHARSRYYHLYLNGLYWGLYQSQEHTEASYAAHYFGGDKDDYDAVKARMPRGGMGATDGTTDAWYHLYKFANAIAQERDAEKRQALYYDLRGLDAEGHPDEEKTVYLDVENLIDYMLVIFYIGSFDAPVTRFSDDRAANNWFAILQRDGRRGFQFFCHDTEHSLGSDGDALINRLGPFPAGDHDATSNPQWIHQQLMAVDQYRKAFQERAEWALLSQEGPLTYEASLRRLNRRAETVGKAIVAECARWGDHRSQPGYTKQNWEEAVERVRDVLKMRSEILPEQLRQAQRFTNGDPSEKLKSAPLFNPVPVPAISWRGEEKGKGSFRLSQGGTVFYTTDGSDPRTSPVAKKAIPTHALSRSLLPAGQMIRAFVPQDNSLAGAWTKLDFDDGQWRAGMGGAGYDRRGSYQDLLGVDLAETMAGRHPALLTRSSFQWDGQSADRLILELKFEDGFVAYLNGEEVASHNAPRDRREVNLAIRQHRDREAVTWKAFDITEHLSALRRGENVLAIQGMNDRLGSSDLLVYPQLVAERDLAGTEISVMPGVRDLRARALVGGNWGPMRVVPIIAGDAGGAAASAKAGNVVISEIMYHPEDPTQDEIDDVSPDPEDYEFVELMNISDGPVNLSGAAFTQGIEYEFPNATQLEAGERVVLVKHRGAFEKRYGSQARVLGLYDGGLKNSGERVTLEDAAGEVIVSVRFRDDAPWPESADGLGFSLVLKAPETNPSANQAGNWQASSRVGGNPGAGDVLTPSGVVINEILTHTDLPDVDAIEIHNPTGDEIDVSGWFLTDDRDEPGRFPIAPGTKIPAGGYLVIEGAADGHGTRGAPPANGIAPPLALSSHGEEVYLFAADASGNPTGYSHGFDFIASENGVSFGRHINSVGKEQFPPQSRVTLGAANAGPRRPLVVISEIMYHPADEDEEGEFVEIWNWSERSVPLFDPMHPENTWRLSGVRFAFPPNQTLAPNEVAVISKLRPETFRRRYDLPESLKVFGPLVEVKVSNKGERLRLLRPDSPDLELEPPVVPMLEVDTVRYNDRDPWPEDADGGGVSLERDPETPFSDDPAAWRSSSRDEGTPGVIPGRAGGPGD